ncbi:hypothetical protein Tsubulata_011504 [Turnera subulata]|uniref:Flavin-containing monooxygenase n=1 Tax=Turnera subulata TaxID=218843 RepID=A0A9Q0JM94_9ROSI|nr:hypothetical protein Tsubulata_011504 [Turnera subulata]
MGKQLAIIGAGVSGLAACKYALERGFSPIVFEADDSLGGVWVHTLETTKLQDPKDNYQFSDFPWPSWVKEVHPSSSQVVEYLESYAKHFGIFPHVRFNSKVIGIDYIGESCEEIESWEFWGGKGKPFGSQGIWHIKVQNVKSCTFEVYEAEFVVLCIGQFSGVPYIPEFPPNKGPQVFKGKVIHSMDYSNMDNRIAREFIKGKRVAVVGSHKSALDIAMECANMNRVDYPCTLIQRTPTWFVPIEPLLESMIGFLYLNRFSEFMSHKPGESVLLSILATMLSPLGWAISKLTEAYLRWNYPLKKYGMLPKTSFIQHLAQCQMAALPNKFYDRVEEGSIIIKNSPSFSFYETGLTTEGDNQRVDTDIVILATGFKTDEKLKNIFESPVFQEWILGSPTSAIPLYRQILHPRIPQLAVVGYVDSFTTVLSSEIKSQWLMQFLDGKIELPCVSEMEKEATMWGDHIKQTTGKYFRRSCIKSANIWYTDQLCRDMGCNPRRKKGFLEDLFVPYGPTDYANLLPKQGNNWNKQKSL